MNKTGSMSITCLDMDRQDSYGFKQNHYQSISFYAAHLITAARKRLPNLKIKGKQKCVGCKQIGSFFQTHHIKPLWACSVDALLTGDFKESDLYYTQRGGVDGTFDFSIWHDPSNLIQLCLSCHPKQQSIDDLIWKIRLADQFKLAYKITWRDLQIADYGRKVKRWSDDRIYIDFYLDKQRQEYTKKLNYLRNPTPNDPRI